MNARIKTRAWWVAVTVLLLLAFGLRVWDLSAVPPGLTHDEASNSHDGAAILRGIHRIYFPVGYGHEPLYNYSVALTTVFLGQGIFTLRVTTVFWGMAQCICTAALARRWWGRSESICVLAAYTVSFWALMLARIGLRAPTLPALLAASVLAYDHATTSPTSRRGRAWFVLAGLLLGACFYTYMASRGMPALYLGFLASAIVLAPGRARQLWRGTMLTLVTAAIVGSPLFVYLRAHPELEQRIGQLGHGITALLAGDWRPLWQNVVDSLPMLLWRGDPYWLYNIAGRPGLEPVLAALFVLGVVVALLRLRDLRHTFVLIWLAGGVAPALLAPVAYNLLHAVAAMPAAFLLISLGMRTLWLGVNRLDRRTRFPVQALVAVVLVAAIVLTGVETVRAYFGTWAENRDVRVAYHHHVVALGRYLRSSDSRAPIVATSLYPGEFHDPYTLETALRRDDLEIRWADGRDAIFVPDMPARLFVEEQTQLSELLLSEVNPDLVPLTTIAFRNQDIPAWTRGYAWNAPATWSRLTSALDADVWIARDDPPPSVTHKAVATPVDFEAISLIGYRTGRAETADESLELMTVWEVTGPAPSDLAIFVHLLDYDGAMVSQDDRLGAPSWQWEAGDRFAQVHRLSLPQGLAPDTYYLALGIYERASLDRLPIAANGLTGSATRALLPVEVTIP